MEQTLDDFDRIEWLILLSGPVAVGKTTLRDELVSYHGFNNIRSSDYLRQRAAASGLTDGRYDLQELGDKLDLDTDFRWLVDDVTLPLMRGSIRSRWIVDAVRKRRQVHHFRSALPGKVLHVHLTAPEDLIRDRFVRRLGLGGVEAHQEYVRAVSHSNEQASRDLIESADLVLDTSSKNEGFLGVLLQKIGALAPNGRPKD